jgi:hypothetical protein
MLFIGLSMTRLQGTYRHGQHGNPPQPYNERIMNLRADAIHIRQFNFAFSNSSVLEFALHAVQEHWVSMSLCSVDRLGVALLEKASSSGM